MNQRITPIQLLVSAFVGFVVVLGLISLKPTPTKEEQEIRLISDTFGITMEEARYGYRVGVQLSNGR